MRSIRGACTCRLISFRQPDQHRLELGSDVIGELQTALRTLSDGSKIPQVHDRFIVYPLPTRLR